MIRDASVWVRIARSRWAFRKQYCWHHEVISGSQVRSMLIAIVKMRRKLTPSIGSQFDADLSE